MSEASLPPEGPADLVLQEVAFARLAVGFGARAVSQLREAAHDPELEVRRRAEDCLRQIQNNSQPELVASAGRLLASQAALRLPPRPGSGLAPLGLLYLSAPRVEAETTARRGEGSQGVRLDSERGDRARTERVTYDGSRELVTSDTALAAQGPGYRVRSRGFVARADGSEVQLVGGVAGRISGGGR